MQGFRLVIIILMLLVFSSGVYAGESTTIDMSRINFIRRVEYTSFISIIKTAPAVGMDISYLFDDKFSVGFDMAYAAGTNKGRNYSISTHSINMAYDFVKSGNVSWYVVMGAGTAFLELQRDSIHVGRELVFATTLGSGIKYTIMEKYSFGFNPEKRVVIDPVISNISINADVRSISTQSNLPFIGGTTFGRFSLGFVMGF